MAAFSAAEMWLDFIIIRTVFRERPDEGRCLLTHVSFASKCGIIRTLVEYFNRSGRFEKVDAEPVLKDFLRLSDGERNTLVNAPFFPIEGGYDIEFYRPEKVPGIFKPNSRIVWTRMKFDRLRTRMSRNLKKLENFAELIERYLRLRFNPDALAEAIAKAPPGFFVPFASAAPVYLRHDPPKIAEIFGPPAKPKTSVLPGVPNLPIDHSPNFPIGHSLNRKKSDFA
jgi:hypothetical protein